MVSKLHTTLVILATIFYHFRVLSLMRKEVRIEVTVLRVIAIIFLPYFEIAVTSVGVDVGSTSRGVASSASSTLPFLLSSRLVLVTCEFV